MDSTLAATTPAAPADAFREVFRLRPARGAVVSEISEATAASPVPPDERVNFHIGNPVQDPRLIERYARIALSLDPERGGPADSLPARLLGELGWDASGAPKIEFLVDLIRKSAPYLPRGGYLKSKPGELIRLFGEWLNGQPEPLAYDTGEKSGRRELILASGGVVETLRVLFHGLSTRLQRLPGLVLAHGLALPPHLRQFGGLRFTELPGDAAAALEETGAHLDRSGNRPVFLLLGRILTEEARRKVRVLSRDRALFVIEANDAPNHLSLAREAGMMEHTLRLMTPAVLAPWLGRLSTVFVAGFEEYVGLIETMHFQLKGTPSAAELELLVYLLKNGPPPPAAAPPVNGRLYTEGSRVLPGAQQAASAIVARFEEKIQRAAEEWPSRAAARLERLTARRAGLAAHATEALAGERFRQDPLEGMGFHEILDALPARQDDLVRGFLCAFLRHHPEYRFGASLVASGSARTALSLLGFHAGIEEAVVPDLSWTYEHCFPKVTGVPLTAAFELDVPRLLAVVEDKLRRDAAWRDRGAVVLNNPHNATGMVFREEDLRALLTRLLERGVLVIDDLSYQNVAPSRDLQGPPTLRQLADDLARLGYISPEHAARLVTVHSLSKTDCLAGARLAVVEIRDEALRSRFEAVNATITPNLGAILLAYLFYRNDPQQTNSYWRLRNEILEERMGALEKAAAGLPDERNPFGIVVTRPAGSLYPRMTLRRLPAGVSLDWIASGLARQGIGLVPLSTFAHTEEGFEAGRASFRLTLGGVDPAAKLLTKTRRVLIDLNRIVAEEESHYNRRALAVAPLPARRRLDHAELTRRWAAFGESLPGLCRQWVEREVKASRPQERWEHDAPAAAGFARERLGVFTARFQARIERAEQLLALAGSPDGRAIADLLEPELYKDDLARRQREFRRRLFDRTVHPTQMYSIASELLWDRAIERVLAGEDASALAGPLARALAREYLGLNVAITSQHEGDELLLDLGAAVDAEDLGRFRSASGRETFLSYWGDWDGSNRPSGQGHRLIATVLMENVDRMGRLLLMLLKANPALPVDPKLAAEVGRLGEAAERSRALFDEITDLTHQLERRYRGLLPFAVDPGPLRKLGMQLRLARDPAAAMWEHNDRLERRMLDLRRRRRQTLEHYFALNKSLRKTLRAHLAEVGRQAAGGELALAAAGFRDLLRRFAITPRIHQSLVTSPDPFAIDTTAHNIAEINEIAGRHGNPGMVLALQVSMSSDAEALISLDRKMRAKREEVLRSGPCDIPSVWLVPLFEDVTVTSRVPAYLSKVWDYAVQSRRLAQTPEDRFSEIICEVFIAGSDLSQQIGQAAGLAAFKQAKFEIVRWLAERGLAARVRLKMGSGEPMQRQGGYYTPVAGQPAFRLSPEDERALDQAVEPSAKRSTRYAATPLLGVFSSGDLRTFQSNLSERLRHLPAIELLQLLHHVAEAQRFTSEELFRVSEPFTGTRLQFTGRALNELRRLTLGFQDSLVDDFMKAATENFRRILFGAEEDVVGIYVISHFIATSIPPLRDRPTLRPTGGVAAGRGQRILERIAATIPFARYGSSLRAIAHNQAQTFLLGVNQLTTGLFRTINSFARDRAAEAGDAVALADRILPNLPVYEILHTLRLYQDLELRWLGAMEHGFQPGNSALTALREDVDLIRDSVPLFQRELLRRHGVPVAEFFEGGHFPPGLLPALRPDLAVLLQPDLFNTSLDALLSRIGRPAPEDWRREVERLLETPVEIRKWRERAWKILQEPVYARVASFVELATALYSVTRRPPAESVLATPVPRKPRGGSALFRAPEDDSLRQFLAAALEYLAAVPRTAVEVPVNVVRAMREVERIVRIEEQAVSPSRQALLRFYLLQIARAAGENG